MIPGNDCFADCDMDNKKHLSCVLTVTKDRCFLDTILKKLTGKIPEVPNQSAAGGVEERLIPKKAAAF